MEQQSGFIVARGRYFKICTTRGFLVHCSPKVLFMGVSSVENLFGKWLKLDMIYDHAGKLAEVIRVRNLPEEEIPFTIKRDKTETRFVKLTTRVRAVVGSVFRNFGTAWSPTVGRIHICQRHISSNFYSGEEMDMTVMLHVDMVPELWVSAKIWGQSHPDPFPFIQWCAPQMKLFDDARVAKINNSWGILRGSDKDNSELVRILLRDLPPAGEQGRMNLSKLSKDDMGVQVLAYRETGSDKDGASWRALTLLPLGTLSPPHMQTECMEVAERRNENGMIKVDAGVQTSKATLKEITELQTQLRTERTKTLEVEAERTNVRVLEGKMEKFRRKAEGEARELRAELAMEKLNSGRMAGEMEGLVKKMSDLEDALRCPICFDQKTDTVLRCGHLFCGKCLAKDSITQCPTCRQKVTEKRKVFPLW